MKNWFEKVDIMWRISGKGSYQKRHISGRQIVTIAICDLCRTPDLDINNSRIKVYLEKWRNVLFMDDLKIFANSERKVNGLFPTLQIFSNDTAMELGMKNHSVFVFNEEN